MCGIAGWIGPDVGWRTDTWCGGLRRRGPDGSGVWSDSEATLVHTRLAVIDLSEASAQPMTAVSSSGSVRAAMVFNGEIYNFRDLRDSLARDGVNWRSDGDAEVLLELFARDRDACLPSLAGMFAFAFWDPARRQAWLARDAFGIKPLYYRIEGRTLAFASQASLLTRSTDGVDSAALRDFLMWGSVPEPATLDPAVRLLPAGHWLKFDAASGAVSIGRWHHPRWNEPTVGMTRASAAATVRAALEESVRRHLVSDVPVGVFLSGGIDSTVVLALTRNALGPDADIRTFSIGFDDPGYDESAIARRTAEAFGTVHTEWRMTADEGAAEIPAFLDAVDQPSIDGFNTWCVAKLARREGMKVVLSGLGGDEWFGGYDSFRRVPQFRHLHRMPAGLRSMIASLLRVFPPGSLWRRLAAFLRSGGSRLDAYHVQRGIFTRDEADLIAQRLAGLSVAESADTIDDDPACDGRAAVGCLEVTRYMRNQLLRDSDVFSMAHGLELRVPMVDGRLADALLTIPPELRLLHGKRLLLDAVPEVPRWVAEQPKRGFRFPFRQWLTSGFGGMLAKAARVSPVTLREWYRTWAVAIAIECLERRNHDHAGT
jgi:asparagine synthase (glutamine-hydrolysing)